jgi:hypothetical protein
MVKEMDLLLAPNNEKIIIVNVDDSDEIFYNQYVG